VVEIPEFGIEIANVAVPEESVALIFSPRIAYSLS
jgi:hypothetical protein